LESAERRGLVREGLYIRLTDTGVLVLDDIVLPFYESPEPMMVGCICCSSLRPVHDILGHELEKVGANVDVVR
jgi:hypothetical protein